MSLAPCCNSTSADSFSDQLSIFLGRGDGGFEGSELDENLRPRPTRWIVDSLSGADETVESENEMLP